MDPLSNNEPVQVAVVSADPHRSQRIADAFAGQGHEVLAEVAQVSSLAESDPAPGLVVLVLEGTRSALSAEIGTAREQFEDAVLLLVVPKGTSPDPRTASLGVEAILDEAELTRTLAVAIAALRAGLAVLPRDLSAATAAPTLSSREKQVLSMLVMGLTNGEIATRLYLAESTVKSHLSSAFRKLGVRSRKDAVARILDPDNGLGVGILAISGRGDR